ncbi:MAG: hypothetical protein RL172_805 [Bacteroidota bacterium]|jgi:hypothetical protein
MNLRLEILAEHSKAQCNKIVQWVGDDDQRFEALFQLFLKDEYRVVQRAAWPVSYCVQAHPQLMNKRLGKLLKHLEQPGIHDAVKRNSVRLLQHIDIPVRYQGRVMNICFNYVYEPGLPVAIKAFALTVLGNLALQYPEIIPEITLLIETELPHQTAAFTSRAKKLLKQFSRVKP